LPDPILRLRTIIGFGGCSTRWVLWTQDSSVVVYPCHAVIVALHIHTGEQRFFMGHTDKRVLLAALSLLCSSLNTPIHSLSPSPAPLCSSQPLPQLCARLWPRCSPSMVVVWNTAQVTRGGEVAVLAKAHTDVDIQALKIAFFDDTRMVSCGRASVRLWRLKAGFLRSCPVALGQFQSLEFTDLTFEETQEAERDLQGHTLFVCSSSGHVLELDYESVCVRSVRRLLPTRPQHCPGQEQPACGAGPGIAINSISISSAFCATGSEDGYLRLWPRDFSAVVLEAEHEAAVSCVCISPDGRRVLSSTAAGSLGCLDIASWGYSTLMRSHGDSVLAFSIQGLWKHMATVSQDNTIRVWDLSSMQQLYDFTAADETPCAVAFHPAQHLLACGFDSGTVRIFDLASSDLLVEHRQHHTVITGLTFTPDGKFMFSSCLQGTLALYSCTEQKSHVLRVLGKEGKGRSGGSSILGGKEGKGLGAPEHWLEGKGSTPCLKVFTQQLLVSQLLRVDISTLDVNCRALGSAARVCFAPSPRGELLVSTSARKLLVLDVRTGRLVREVSGVHKLCCSSLAPSRDGRYLLTAGDKVLKVWDYQMRFDVNFQVFIGHSEPVRQVAFSPDQQHVLSVGDAIFLWDFLAAPEGSEQLKDACGSPGQTVPVPPLSSALCLAVSPVHPAACPGKELLPGKATIGFVWGKAPCPAQQQGASFPSLQLLTSSLRSCCGSTGCSLPLSLCVCVCVDVPTERATSPGLGAAPSQEHHPQRSCFLLCLAELREGSTRAQSQSPIRPDSYRHFTPRFKASQLPQSFSSPPAGSEVLKLKAVMGYNGNGRGNMVWSPDTGFFAYTCGCIIVVEDLHSGSQSHWLGHTEEISVLAISHNAQVLASASGRRNGDSHCQICIWNIQDGVCTANLFHHQTQVQAMAFSGDDRLLVTLGDYNDQSLALWDTCNLQLLAATGLSQPAHDVAFSPSSPQELVCVGKGALMFWLLEQQGADVSLKVHRAPAPAVLGPVELTCVCYGAEALLYTGTNSGHICVWDTQHRHCFMTWEADEGEIGVLVCAHNRLLSGSNTKRIRLWAAAAVPELRLKGPCARSSSVLLEHEMPLDGTIVSAAFDESLEMGIVGTTAGTLWYINWAESTSIRLISGHRSKVTAVGFSPDETHCATCGEDGSVRLWSLGSMELVVQFQVLNQ
ncbi:WDR90 protein, partial [Urocolius indicus]|nr:WDR90 protein [Urocolius indicus]